MKKYIMIMALNIGVMSCATKEFDYDAAGSFEAVETIISAEANGKIMKLDLQEGDKLTVGQEIGYIDSTQLSLQRKQLAQNIIAVLANRPDIKKQVDALREQLQTAKANCNRTSKLVAGGIANQKQLDDANMAVATLEAQISAMLSNLNIQTSSINEQANLVELQLQSVEDQLAKCKIVNPVKGVVLTKYVEPYEMTSAGRPLYRIADLSTITLRAYITGSQLPKVKIGQHVTILTDENGDKKEASGTVTWISSKSEFTPKSIHTTDERSNLVYAIKVIVPNDGTYKIGMYGELKF
ncbi:MAG: HlyD family secretion protein [Mangrovibacterium sp.]